jgi:hypothetical protein
MSFFEVFFIFSLNISMRLHEFSNPLKTYLATVRVVLKNGSTTARTTVAADSTSNAYLLLVRAFGQGNVVNLSEIVSESPQTDQIQREAAITTSSSQRAKRSSNSHPRNKVKVA